MKYCMLSIFAFLDSSAPGKRNISLESDEPVTKKPRLESSSSSGAAAGMEYMNLK